MKNKPNRAFKDSRNAPKKGRPEPKPRRRDDAEKETPENEDFVMGRHPVLELLRSDRDVNKLFIQDGLGGEKLGDIIKLAKDRKIQIQAVPKSKLDTLSDNAVHQGVIAATAASSMPYSMICSKRLPPRTKILSSSSWMVSRIRITWGPCCVPQMLAVPMESSFPSAAQSV